MLLDGRDRRGWTAPAWRKLVAYNAAEPGGGPRVADHFPGTALDHARRLASLLNLSPDLMLASLARLSTGERQRLALVRALGTRSARAAAQQADWGA